jgi:hypothetical protein
MLKIGWRASGDHEIDENHEMGGGVWRPRSDTEDHGIGRADGARRVTTKYTKVTKWGAAFGGHGVTRKITELGGRMARVG